MRLRNRFLAFIVLITLAIGSAVFYYNRPSVQAKIRGTVIEVLQEALGGEVSVDSISIGLLSATAKNFKLSLNSQFVQIEVEKIQVGVGIIRIPKKGEINPRDFVDKIILTNPKIRVIVYADPERKEEENLPKMSSSELSDLIVKNIPFATAKIKNCSIEIITKNGRKLADFNGLNGKLSQQNDELNFELSGKSGLSLTNNIEIISKITPDVKRQFLSVKLDDVSIRSPLIELEGYAAFVLDGDMKFFFKDDYFPEAVIPTGTLSIKEMQVRQRNRGVTFAASMDIAADSGILNLQNVFTKFGQGEMNGFAQMDLNLGGKTVGEFNLSILANEKTVVKTKVDLFLTELLNPKLYVTANGDITQKKKDLLHFNANGDVSDGKVFLRNLEVKSDDFGNGKFAGTVVPGINYSLDGNINLNAKIDKNIKALGSAKVAVRGGDFVKFPHIFGNVDLKIKKDDEFLNLPSIKVDTYGDSLEFSANSGGVQLFGGVELKNDFAYNADLEISGGKIKEILAFLGQNADELENISVSAKIEGDTSGLNFSSNPFVFTKNFGNFTADMNGKISEKQKNININSLKWTKDGNEFSFKGNVKNAANSWNASLSSRSIQANAIFDENFTKIDTCEIKIDKMPLKILDAFYKSQNKIDSLLKSGDLYGDVKLSGKFDNIFANGEIGVKNAYIENIKNISAEVAFFVSDSAIIAENIAIKQDEKKLISSQKIEKTGEKIFGEVSVENFLLQDYLLPFGINDVKGNVSATLTANGDKFSAKIHSDSVFYEKFKAQKLDAKLSATHDSIFINELTTEFLGIKASANAKAVHDKFKLENPQFQVKLNGDFLSAAGNFVESPVAGKSKGEMEVSGSIRGGELRIREGHVTISNAELSVYPFARENIKDVYVSVKTTGRNNVSLALQGTLDKKKLTIMNDYNVGELTPFKLANLNFGVLRVWTDKGGIPVFIPGFMENRKGNVGFIETAAKGEIPTFTVASHPDNLVTLAGTLLLRKTDLTFPLLDDVEYQHEFDPFPFMYFDLDIRPADRTVNYYYQIGRENRRRGFRIIEFAIDPSGTVGVRGNDADGTFRVVGRLRSYSGYMFYGKMFDKNFEIGLDFQPELLPNGFGYDNLPIIWGKAETFSDTSRFERISVKLKTRDPQTGELRDRGRFTELVIVPQNDNLYVSQDEVAAKYYEEISRNILNIEEIGEMASGIGDSYISSYFLSYWGRQIARKVGFDSFRFESAVMGNTVEFLAARQIDETTTRNWNYLAFANSSFTLGKYIGGNGNLFLKYETQFVARELEISPEYKIGLEYQPFPYLWMDFNYGIFREREDEKLVMNPQVGVQFRMPFSTLRKKIANREK
jgi:hypothetical protein